MRRAFTLIELLIVISIIGIILAMGTWAFVGVRQKQSLALNANQISSLVPELRGYSTSTPTTVKQLCSQFAGLASGTINNSLIDPGKNLYLGVSGTQNQVVKVDLANYTRTGVSMTNLSIPSNILYAPLMDPNHKFIYYGGYDSVTTKSTITRVDLTTFKEAQAIELKPQEKITTAVIDSTGTYGYFGTSTTIISSPVPNATIYKVKLADLSITSQITLNATSSWYLTFSTITPDNKFAYFGYDNPGYGIIVPIDLTSFTEQTVIDLFPTFGDIGSMVYDAPSASLYLSNWNVSTKTNTLLRVDPVTKKLVTTKTLQTNAYSPVMGGVLDKTDHNMYFSSIVLDTTTMKLKEVDAMQVSLNNPAPPIQLFSLGNNDTGVSTVAPDVANGNVYYAGNNTIATGNKYEAIRVQMDANRIMFRYQVLPLFQLILKGIDLTLYNPPKDDKIMDVIAHCGLNNGATVDAVNDYNQSAPSLIPGGTVSASTKFVDTSGNPVNYKISFAVTDPNAANVGNVTISTVKADGNVIATGLKNVRMTDGNGTFYNISINSYGGVSVAKE